MGNSESSQSARTPTPTPQLEDSNDTNQQQVERTIPSQSERAVADICQLLENLDVGYMASVDGFRFVRISKIRSWHRWKRWQDLEDSDYELSNGRLTDRENHLYFISHRWLTKDYPDPEGTQLERIKQLADGDALLFYDYCSLPQEPRNATEQFLFDALLEKLNTLIPKMKVIILVDEEYMTRSWCLMEYFISAFHGSIICDQKLDSNMTMLHSLACSLPPAYKPKSVFVWSEAWKAERMGVIARWFFESLKESQVTKKSDIDKILHILRVFVAQNIKFWDYDPCIGWQPRPLSSQEVDDLFDGRPVRLVAVDLPEDLERFSPQTGDHMGEQPAASFTDMERIWEKNRSHRLSNRIGTYGLLNNAEAKLNLKIV